MKIRAMKIEEATNLIGWEREHPEPKRHLPSTGQDDWL
jgi:hypothetical protein